jgi:hypothetical protein
MGNEPTTAVSVKGAKPFEVETKDLKVESFGVVIKRTDGDLVIERIIPWHRVKDLQVRRPPNVPLVGYER